MDYRIRTLVDLVQADLAHDIDVGRLASIVGMSVPGLRLLFKRDVGLPPQRFIKQLRLERARSILCSQMLSVKEVMVIVGFRDESHFVKDFARRYGLSPLRYRQQFFGRLSPHETSAGPTYSRISQ